MLRKGLNVVLIIGLMCSTILFSNPLMQTVAEEETTKVIIHYAKDPATDKDWNLWVWAAGQEGSVFEFIGEDNYGVYAEIVLQGRHEKVGFIVRTDSWEKDVEQDRFIEQYDNGVGEIWLKAGDPEIYTTSPDGSGMAEITHEEVKMTIHYYRYDGNYEGWNLWFWPEGKDGDSYSFTSENEFGKVATFTVPHTKGAAQLGFLLRKSTADNEWAEKEFDDRFIRKINEEGSVEIWLAQGDQRIYYFENNVDREPRIISATLDELDVIHAETNIPFSYKGVGTEDFTLSAEGKNIEIGRVTPIGEVIDGYTREVQITLVDHVALDQNIVMEKKGYGSMNVTLGKVMESETFEDLFYYDGNDLGNTYYPEATSFKLWAPTATEAMLVTYRAWDDEEGKEVPMQKGEKGTWTLSLDGDQQGLHYTYKVKIGGDWNEAVDPYARAVAINGNHGVVIDLSKSNPNTWEPNTKPPFENAVDAIIYELHVRDLSIHPESGIKHKGKFLGLTERGSTGPQGTKTGLDHILDLGVTHVQLLPIYDYNSLNERETSPQFNWGYDPKNYNAPEGTYATDPYDPLIRITELKQAIQALHDNGVRVIMDVVYNHMFDAHSSNFHKLVPGYYYRYNDDGTLVNGTGVGNDTASERKMMRKFIVDSVTYWAKEYNLDGYRFDLMGIHDIETMNEVREALDKIDPSIIVIGEGWDMGTRLPAEKKANQKNAQHMPRIAHFNDTIRDGVKGSIWNHADPGFVNGLQGAEVIVKTGVVGGIAYDRGIRTWGDVEPNQVVTYVEAHDNHTLWDKLTLTNGDESEDIRKQMHKLASSIALTSQGLSFIHAGQEFIRTKYGDENSYKSPDAYNRLEWDRKAEHEDVVDYFKGMIHLRKSHPAFRMTSADMIREHLHFLEVPANVVAYTITGNANGDEWKEIAVAYNANREPQQITLSQSGDWHIVLNGENAGTETIEVIKGNIVTVPALSAMVLHSAIAKGSSISDLTEKEDGKDNGLYWLIGLLIVVASAGFGGFKWRKKHLKKQD